MGMLHFSKFGLGVAVLSPLVAIITYYDVRYRRIPNVCVLVTLFCGVTGNAMVEGWRGALNGLAGCGFAFCLMFTIRILGAMGAGDVKLFAAIGAVIGTKLVLPAFLVASITGGALALVSVLYWGAAYEMAQRVSLIFVSLLTNFTAPRFAPPPDPRRTIPYGVAIALGSLISLMIFET
jgi:prepilin peptidase CpaA